MYLLGCYKHIWHINASLYIDRTNDIYHSIFMWYFCRSINLPDEYIIMFILSSNSIMIWLSESLYHHHSLKPLNVIEEALDYFFFDSAMIVKYVVYDDERDRDSIYEIYGIYSLTGSSYKLPSENIVIWCFKYCFAWSLNWDFKMITFRWFDMLFMLMKM